jgi:hypothetical protein
MRAAQGEEARVYRDIQLSDRFRRALRTKGIEFFERNISPGQRIRYQLRLLDKNGGVLSRSKRLDVEWREPPTRPDKLDGRATTSGTVELHWESNAPLGAIVFRRNVLEDDSDLERIGQVGPDSAGLFVDRRAEAGVVYAYRVSLASTTGELTQFGPPSEAVYVDVPLP